LKPNKYDLKEIFTKNKIAYQNYKVYGGQKKGVKLFVSSKLDENLPF
jgi:hypothetical protein